MKYFGLIWAGLWRKKARTIFTMLSIVVAFLLFGLLQGINQGFNQAVQNLNLDRLYVSAKSDMTDGLPIAYLERIKAVPGVRAVSYWSYFGGYYQNSNNALPAFATDAEQLFKVYREIKVNPEYIEAMQRTRTGALVSDQLAKQYGWKVGDRIPVGTSIWTNKEGSNTWYFDIVGTFDLSAFGAGFPSFYLNHAYFKEAAAFGDGVVHYYLVGLDKPTLATQVSKQIDTMFENSSYETRTQTESALFQMQMKQIGDINFIANAIVGAVLFTLLFLTANTMMQSVRERTSELAVLKTLGFSDTKVLALVLVEALLLCVFAAAMGLFLASLVFPALKPIFGDFKMPLVVVGFGAGMALVLALVSGLPPAWRARQLNIVDALAGR
ncbi:putative ABC transport system permease protein [Povalibacter uvarum]|uniref:Putative ABC transport system permease protein n=1 Tax=Povalibacter uvarum TaxID=732238 RepID=A0A841HQ41_9GAMM|nr:FtsX-like permease family protein [Povalibacter uvarum]MBB6094449.1 putative ABC transport system permease protein [Povalibacter uvarum]